MRLYKLKNCARVHGLHFTPDCMQLMIAYRSQTKVGNKAVWLDLAEGIPTVAVSFFTGVYGGEAYAISTDHSRLVVGNSVDQPINLQNLIHSCDPLRKPVRWQANDLQIPWSEGMDLINPYCLALSPNGKRLLVGYIWQDLRPAPDGGQRPTKRSYHLASCHLDHSEAPTTIDVDSSILSVAYGPNGIHWAMSQRRGNHSRVGLYENFCIYPQTVIELPGSHFYNLRFSSDGKFLAAFDSFKSVMILKADRLSAVGILKISSKKQMSGFSFAPDGSRIATSSGDGTIRIWDTVRSEPIESFDWKIGPLTAVAFSPDGLLCAAGGKNGQIVVWDVD